MNAMPNSSVRPLVGAFILVVVAAVLYWLISRTGRPTNTVFIKVGLAAILAPFVLLVVGLVLEFLGAKGKAGHFFVAVAPGFISVPVGLLLAPIHTVVRTFSEQARP